MLSRKRVLAFSDVHCTTKTTWNLLVGSSMEDVNIYDIEFSFLFLNLEKVFKNSTTGKRPAYIWQIERFQIDTMKFERKQIHFFSDVFIYQAV